MRFGRVVLFGAVCWVLAAPVLVVAELVVGFGWGAPGYDWSSYNISDLGNVTCGVWDTSRPRYVCSPWHEAMNVALMVASVLVLVGLVLAGRVRAVGRVAWVLMVCAAAGLGLAGLFPADVNENVHVLGAFLVFVCGNVGLLLAGRGVGGRPGLVTSGLGVVGLVAAGLFLAQRGLGLGLGTMERLAVYPLWVWACVAGVRLWVLGRSGGEDLVEGDDLAVFDGEFPVRAVALGGQAFVDGRQGGGYGYGAGAVGDVGERGGVADRQGA
jgi:hypothetical membrane protein